MEFYAVRAMDIARLNAFQIDQLHEEEKRCVRCLDTREIQSLFHVPTLKTEWGIPDPKKGPSPWPEHAERIWRGLKELGLPVIAGAGWSTLDSNIHNFDRLVFQAVQEKKIDFKYKGASDKGSLLDQVNQEDGPGELVAI